MREVAELYNLIKYYKALAAAVYANKAFLDTYPEAFFEKGARPSEIRAKIKALRQVLRAVRPKETRAARARQDELFLSDKMGITSQSRTVIQVKIGSIPTALKTKTSFGAPLWEFTVGEMFCRRVIPLSHNRDFGGNILLAANRIRVNDKDVDMYDCKVLSPSKSVATAYLAVHKREPSVYAMRPTAAAAIKELNARLSAFIDAKLN